MTIRSLLRVCLFLTVFITGSAGGGQDTDRFDTLHLRGHGDLLVPVFDTVTQLEKANNKADTIIDNLQSIKTLLGIKDDCK